MGAVGEFLVPLGVRVQEDGVGDGEEGVFGGYFIWLILPPSISAKALASRCLEEENLIIAPGHLFEVQGDDSLKFPNEVRVCFAWEGEAELYEGVERMRRVLRKTIADGGGK